jgi:uncharacterized protein YcaQ
MSSTGLSVAQARRIAVRAQLLDGSATDVLSTVRSLGFLQIDPISVVAQPQHLVLWSRVGPFDRGELDRLLWEERKLFEWNAFIWPIEDLPLIRARMRERWGRYKWQRWAKEFLKEQAKLRKYVLRELERRGPLLSRELEHPAARADERYVWWGTRAQLTWMLELLHRRGLIAVAGRVGGERLWDLAERWFPATETVPIRDALRLLDEKRFRALGVRLERGRLVPHAEVVDGPVANRITFLSPFDRLVYDRARAEALWGFRYRLEMYVPPAKREYGYYVLPILRGDRLLGRIEPVVDRKNGVLRVQNVWWEDGKRPVSLNRPLRSLAKLVGAKRIEQ